MKKDQQEETLKYFRNHADEWAHKATGKAPKYNVIAARNDYVLRIISGRLSSSNFLDIGCGTGELAIAAGGLVTSSLGVDFAKEMIDICQANVAIAKQENVAFLCKSVFDADLTSGSFDIISANGVIEYISLAELEQLLQLCIKLLAPGGSLVLGSRNRLFNVYSLNAFTQEEVNSGTAPALLRESIAIVDGASIEDLLQFVTAPLPDTNKDYHSTTGIEVTTRHQYTPAQLSKLVKLAGLEPVHLGGVHIHGALPKFKDQYVSDHVAMANLLGQYCDELPELIPQASTFMLHATKN
jgi:2-polyprenyl-3-methyl-5-hydroxy-6-metoxy-1,4-benzoquinol methylase